MSDKMYSNRSTNSQQEFGVQMPFRAAATGAAHPVFVEGDKEGVASGYYLAVQRGATGPFSSGFTGSAGGPTGMTGVYVIHTQDPFAGFADLSVQLIRKTNSGTLGVELLPAKQNSDGTWDIPFRVFLLSDGTSQDLAVGDGFNAVVFMRNSTNKP